MQRGYTEHHHRQPGDRRGTSGQYAQTSVAGAWACDVDGHRLGLVALRRSASIRVSMTVAEVERRTLAEHPDETDTVLAAEAAGKNCTSLAGVDDEQTHLTQVEPDADEAEETEDRRAAAIDASLDSAARHDRR